MTTFFMRVNDTIKKDLESDHTSENAFTLIELLVVIAVIGVLSTAVFFALNPSGLTKKSRDSKQVQELLGVAKGFDLYSVNYGRYPTSLEEMGTGISTQVPTPPSSVAGTLGTSYGFRSVNSTPRTWGFLEEKSKYYVYDSACHAFFLTSDNPDTDSFDCSDYVEDSTPLPPPEPPVLYAVTGFIDVQGRANDSGVFVVFSKAGSSYNATSASSGKYTLSIPAGTYSVSADKNLYLQGQTSITVSGTTSVPIHELIGADIDGDGTITAADSSIVSSNYGKTCSSPGFNPSSDVNGDCTVDILDLSLVGGNTGKTEPTAWGN